jgi:hypothetical protein
MEALLALNQAAEYFCCRRSDMEPPWSRKRTLKDHGHRGKMYSSVEDAMRDHSEMVHAHEQAEREARRLRNDAAAKVQAAQRGKAYRARHPRTSSPDLPSSPQAYAGCGLDSPRDHGAREALDRQDFAARQKAAHVLTSHSRGHLARRRYEQHKVTHETQQRGVAPHRQRAPTRGVAGIIE